MNPKRTRYRRLAPVIVVSALLSGAGSLAVIGLYRAAKVHEDADAARAKLEEVSRQAKTEADRTRRAREQAEELVAFVFSELRGKLDAIGRADLLESAGLRALDYYDNLPPELRTLEGEERRADLLEEIAVVQYQQGRLEESEAAHRRALQIREDICERGPANDEWHWRHARGWHEFSYTLIAAEKYDEADSANLRSRKLCDARTGIPDAKWRRVLSKAIFGLGESARSRKQYELALERYAEALPHATTALELLPEDAATLRSVATIYNNMGVCCLSLGRLDEAETHARKNIDMERDLVRLEPEVRQWKKELATSLNNLASLHRKRKDYDSALVLLDEALALRRGLVEWDPSNTRWLSSLNTSWHNLAHLRLDRGEFTEAKVALENSIATCLRGIALQPDDPAPVRDLETLRGMSFKYFPPAGRTEDLLTAWRSAEADIATAGKRSAKNGASAFLTELRALMQRHGGSSAAALRKNLTENLAAFPAAPDDADILRIGWDFARAGAAVADPAFLELARLIGTGLTKSSEPLVAEALRDHAARKLVRAEQVLVSREATWKYMGTTGAPPNWMAADFDDASWPSGAAPLGFGEGDEATRIDAEPPRLTYYFRHRFTVNDPAALRDFRLALERDDGALVYLNGKELCRSGLPEGAAGADTAATLTVMDEMEESAALWFFPQLNLIAGENVLAVEVHQNELKSSDLRLAVELAAGISPPATPDLSAIEPAGKALGALLPPALVDWLRARSQPPPR